MDIIESLKWRYAVKKFDPNHKLSKLQIDRISEGLVLTASSMGMQLMEFIIIENKELKSKIKPIAFDQAQVEDASHLLVLCRKEKVEHKDIKELVEETSKRRGVPLDSDKLQGYEKMLSSALNMPKPQQIIWMENQVYLAMGNLLTICAAEKIDACPMEGFDRLALDKLLNLEEKGVRSVLICPIGGRAKDDKYSGLPKVRRSPSKIISYL